MILQPTHASKRISSQNCYSLLFSFNMENKTNVYLGLYQHRMLGNFITVYKYKSHYS